MCRGERAHLELGLGTMGTFAAVDDGRWPFATIQDMVVVDGNEDLDVRVVANATRDRERSIVRCKRSKGSCK